MHSGSISVNNASYFSKRKIRQAVAGYLFILPSMIGFFLFMFIPTIASFIISLFEWDISTSPIFKGINNYALILKDKLFWNGLKVTLQYLIYHIPASLIIAFIMALAMKQKIRGISLFRTAFVAPWILTPIVVSYIWKMLLDPTFGILNHLSRTYLHLNLAPLVNSDVFPMLSIAVINMWIYCGYHMLIFTAGLGEIPDIFYEAATIDGANGLQRIWYITIPLMRPTFMFAFITSVIGSFQVFDLIFGLYKGGPGDMTRAYYYYLYQNAFAFYKMGYACAMAVVLFIIVVTATIIQYIFFQRNMVTDYSS
jgi:multiple sugar transport system permease protein/sn-glycerol 3-phosphate transport system permease protein